MNFAAAAHGTATPEQLNAALALYRGEFLAGLAARPLKSGYYSSGSSTIARF